MLVFGVILYFETISLSPSKQYNDSIGKQQRGPELQQTASIESLGGWEAQKECDDRLGRRRNK